jgi:hypothetical protein
MIYFYGQQKTLLHMKKVLFSFIIVIFTALHSFAQDDSANKIGVGVDVGVPVGSVSNTYEVTMGVTAKAEIPIASPVNLTFTTGFTGYVTKGGFSTGYNSYDGSYTNGAVACFIPLEAGAKVYVASSRFFVEGDLGLSFNINSTSSDFTSKKVAPMYAPMAGYTIPFGGSRVSLDLSLRYEGRVETGGGYNQVAARALFNFNL